MDILNLEEFEVWTDGADPIVDPAECQEFEMTDPSTNGRTALGDVSTQFHDYYQTVCPAKLHLPLGGQVQGLHDDMGPLLADSRC